MYMLDAVYRLPCKIPNVIIKCVMDAMNIVRKLPKEYRPPPIMPTVRMENFLSKELANRPPKLIALKYEPFTMVTALVPPPKFVIKSLNINPKDVWLLSAQP